VKRDVERLHPLWIVDQALHDPSAVFHVKRPARFFVNSLTHSLWIEPASDVACILRTHSARPPAIPPRRHLKPQGSKKYRSQAGPQPQAQQIRAIFGYAGGRARRVPEGSNPTRPPAATRSTSISGQIPAPKCLTSPRRSAHPHRREHFVLPRSHPPIATKILCRRQTTRRIPQDRLVLDRIEGRPFRTTPRAQSHPRGFASCSTSYPIGRSKSDNRQRRLTRHSTSLPGLGLRPEPD
jgi:hypothetical protein